MRWFEEALPFTCPDPDTMSRLRNKLATNVPTPSATAIALRKYRFSSDHRSQAQSRPVSTWMGDRLGTPGAVAFLFFILIFFTPQTPPRNPWKQYYFVEPPWPSG